MKKNVHILLRLVNQILDFRKVENGRMELNLEPFNLLDSFRTWNDSFRVALIKKHIAFCFEPASGTDYRTLADAGNMERVYFNLLSNAVKYTPENGKIAVRLEAEEHSFRLSVFNSGSYISVSDVEAIFERFYQVDGHQAGMGIGLALVRAFVEMHGGTITVHSDGKGTEFIVTLPKRDVSQCAPAAPVLSVDEAEIASTLVDAEIGVEGETMDEERPTVLVIDDNADIRHYVESLLASEYRVLDAADGMMGIRLAMKYVPDVIVSDVMMPGMDGVECCRRLKGELQTCHIPVILLAASDMTVAEIAYEVGFSSPSYFTKCYKEQFGESPTDFLKRKG